MARNGSFFFKVLCLFSISTLFLNSCSKNSKNEIWIYASVYKEVIAEYEPLLKKAFPEITFKWFQGGSENVAAKVRAELMGGSTKADLIMTSDLFFFQQLKKEGQFLKIDAPALKDLPSSYIDDEANFAVTRFPVMVLGINNKFISPADKPKTFLSLTQPQYKDKISMPSPLESGTALTTVLFLNKKYGPDFFTKLRTNNVLAAGGNGAVLSRMQSGERPIALVLLENIVQAKSRGSENIEYIFPDDGALPMPSPVAIFKSTRNPELAQKVFAWFLSKEAQDILVKGGVYSALANAPAPPGLPLWKDLHLETWNLALFSEWGKERDQVKTLFQDTMLK